MMPRPAVDATGMRSLSINRRGNSAALARACRAVRVPAETSITFESLERREMLAGDFAVLLNGKLTVTGTASADNFTVSIVNGLLQVNLGEDTQNFDPMMVTGITINGGAGNDVITVGNGVIGCYLDGGDGDDWILGGANNDTLQGGNGNDYLDGGSRNDSILGGAGNDKVYGNGGNDKLYGGLDKDTVWGGSGNDLLDGQEQADKVYGGSGNDTLYGGSSNDNLFGESGNDLMYGGNQDDILMGGDGADFFSGGTGIDTADYSYTSGLVNVTLSTSTSPTGDDGREGEFDNVMNDIESVRAGGAWNYGNYVQPGDIVDDNTAAVQAAIDAAVINRRPVVLSSQFEYRIFSPLTIYSGVQITCNDGIAHLRGMGDFAIFNATGRVEEMRLSNLEFLGSDGNVVTGIGSIGAGYYAWSQIVNTHFHTSLRWGINTPALGLTVRDSFFGSGPIPTDDFGHVRITGDGSGGGNNLNVFEDCRFFNASGDSAIVLSDGYLWRFQHCDFELNTTTEDVIRVIGCRAVTVRDSWFEYNNAEYQIRFLPFIDGTGTRVVTIENNWFYTTLSTNTALIGAFGTFGWLTFRSNAGNVYHGAGVYTHITDSIWGQDLHVNVYENNTLIGYGGPLGV